MESDIIGITLPKNRDLNPQDSHFSNLEKCKRGVIIHVRESLNAVSISLQEEGNFEESVWCRVKLKNDDV